MVSLLKSKMVSFPTRIQEFHFPYVITTICFFSGKDYPFFGPHHTVYRILVTLFGIEPGPPAMRAWTLNHWTAREFPQIIILM